MGSKKKGGGIVSLAGTEEQGRPVVQDAKVSKKKSEFEEKKSRSKPSHSKVVKKSFTGEIDEIFANKKRKVVGAEPDDSAVGAGATQEKKKKKVKGADAAMHGQKSSDKSASGSGGKPRKRTIDGYTVYYEDEIGWNKNNAGGSPLCPFDCDCCF